MHQQHRAHCLYIYIRFWFLYSHSFSVAASLWLSPISTSDLSRPPYLKLIIKLYIELNKLLNWILAFNFCILIHSQLQHLYGCLLSPRATFPGPPYLKLVPSLRQQPLTDDKLDTQPGIWKINLYLNCQWVRKCTWLGERCTRWGPFPKVFIWPTPQEIQKWRGRVGLKTQCLYEEWLSTMAISKDAQDGDLFKKFSLDPRLKSDHLTIQF